jgi:hypothetical protein
VGVGVLRGCSQGPQPPLTRHSPATHPLPPHTRPPTTRRLRPLAAGPAAPPPSCCAAPTTTCWTRWTAACTTACAWSSGCWRAAAWCQVRCRRLGGPGGARWSAVAGGAGAGERRRGAVDLLPRAARPEPLHTPTPASPAPASPSPPNTPPPCAGGGAVEGALSIYLENFATTLGSREQLAIAEFADALLVIPKVGWGLGLGRGGVWWRGGVCVGWRGAGGRRAARHPPGGLGAGAWRWRWRWRWPTPAQAPTSPRTSPWLRPPSAPPAPAPPTHPPTPPTHPRCTPPAAADAGSQRGQGRYRAGGAAARVPPQRADCCGQEAPGGLRAGPVRGQGVWGGGCVWGCVGCVGCGP